jgi:MFS family permease
LPDDFTKPLAVSAAPAASVETRRSWLVAATALGILSLSFGAPTITVVALKPIAAEFGDARTVPALCFALAWFGSAVGGLAMGPIAERVGVRWTVAFGALMIAVGLALSSVSGRLGLLVGHGVFMGLLGNSGINAPLYVYVARWFDRRRGAALALIASGQAAAGVLWAPLFGQTVGWFGWRDTMQCYAVLIVAVAIPLALVMFRALPKTIAGGVRGEPLAGAAVLGLRPRTAFSLMCVASFCCCVPMAMPQSHLVAFCGDAGIPLARGSTILSVLLGCAFIGRQLWGSVADRIGGLRTVLSGSACQITAMTGFLLTQDETGLFVVAALFGLAFSGIIPAYVVALREHFPAAEASWRVPTLLLCSGSGMATGGWLAGAIYDYAGFYAAAFATGIVFNLINLVLIGTLVLRRGRFPAPSPVRVPVSGVEK